MIGISVSESEDLLGLGYGMEHLREVMLSVSQRLLRLGANLAYGGHYREESLTRDLIDLIGDEQTEGTEDSRPWIGILYNHSAWPYCDEITDEAIAETIDVCQFLKIDQKTAGISPEDTLPGVFDGERSALNQSIVLSALRRIMVEGMVGPDGIQVPGIRAVC